MSPVVWLEFALDLLADVWVAASPEERDRIAAAVERVNATLADRPEQQGESRDGGNRVLSSLPITVRYRVEPNGTAVVYHVHHVRPRPGR